MNQLLIQYENDRSCCLGVLILLGLRTHSADGQRGPIIPVKKAYYFMCYSLIIIFTSVKLRSLWPSSVFMQVDISASLSEGLGESSLGAYNWRLA